MSEAAEQVAVDPVATTLEAVTISDDPAPPISPETSVTEDTEARATSTEEETGGTDSEPPPPAPLPSLPDDIPIVICPPPVPAEIPVVICPIAPPVPAPEEIPTEISPPPVPGPDETDEAQIVICPPAPYIPDPDETDKVPQICECGPPPLASEPSGETDEAP